MAKKKTQMTWQSAPPRWRKVYKGKLFLHKCASKSDRECKKEAWAKYEEFRAKVDQQSDSEKPNWKQYEKAIRWRKEIGDACQTQIDLIADEPTGTPSPT
jgi:hypothetical protein